MQNAVFILGAALAMAAPGLMADDYAYTDVPADTKPADPFAAESVSPPVVVHADILQVVVAKPEEFHALLSDDVKASQGSDSQQGAISGEAWDDVQDTGFVDPAPLLAADLASFVSRKIGANTVNGVSAPDGKNIINATRQGHAVALRVRTAHWGFRPISARASTYEMTYSAEVALVDEGGAAVTRQACFYTTDQRNAPTYEQMLANDGAIVKAGFAKAESYCVETIKARLFGGPMDMPAEEVLKLLSSDDPEDLRLAARALLFQAPVPVADLDAVASKIAAGRSIKGGQTGDALAWLCKVLGKSGNGRYRPFLEDTAASAVDSTLRHYARVAAEALPTGASEVYHQTSSRQASLQNANPAIPEPDAQQVAARKQAAMAKTMKWLQSDNPDDLKQASLRLVHKQELTVDQMDAIAAVIDAKFETTDPAVAGSIATLCKALGKVDAEGRYKPFLKSIGAAANSDSIRDAVRLAVASMPDPDMNVYSPPPAAGKSK